MGSSPPTFLHGLIRKEARTLMQYIGECSPWTKAADREKLDAILAMSRGERERIETLIGYCIKNKLGNPVLGPYPHSFMDINFVSLAFLKPLLVEEEKKRIADLEWSLLTTPEGARELVRSLVKVKREHLSSLEAIA
jgi:hypothetical protein